MLSFWGSLSLVDKAALVGLLGLAVPLLIHLFNPGRGRVVFIGNIDFIKHARQSRVNEVKPKQWLLLLLRLLILTLLALILAQLVERSSPESISDDYVYVTRDWIAHSSPEELKDFQQKHKNDKLFLLSRDYPPISYEDIVRLKERSDLEFSTSLKSENNARVINNFALIKELENDEVVPENAAFYLTNQLTVLPRTAYSLSQDFQLNIKSLDNTRLQSEMLRVAVIFDQSRSQDKEIIEAAFSALPGKLTKKLAVSFHPLNMIEENQTGNNPEKLISNVDWIFWLSEKTVVDKYTKWLKKGGSLLVDQPQRLVQEKYRQTASISNHRINFNPGKTPQDSMSTSPVWQSVDGKNILVKEPGELFNTFYFYSRFNSQWNDLVEKQEFPAILAGLLVNNRAISETEVIEPSEIMLRIQLEKDKTLVSHSLNSYLIFLLCLLWLIERWFAEWSSPKND